jgi:hypothetical protein
MPDQNGSIYGLTVLSPVTRGREAALRQYLAALPRDRTSPFTRVAGTHMCRLVVMDDVVFVGAPARQEHLKSAYLVYETNFDGGLDDYLNAMAGAIPEVIDGVWSHCAGYLGIGGFPAYIKKCRIPTTFYFADVNNKSVGQCLKALRTQAELARFVAENQNLPAAELQKAFIAFMETLRNSPAPPPGVVHYEIARTDAAGA